MFILDSLMISGIRWALQTVATAADAEMNDDGALREQLLAAEMRREMGELSDEEFRRTEASLLARIREIRERREGGSGPLGFTAPASDEQEAGRISVEASLTGDFHPPSPPAESYPPAASARPASPAPGAEKHPPATARPVPPFAEKPRRPVASARPVPPSRRRAASRAAVAAQPRQRKPRPDAYASGRARKRRT